MIEEMKSFRWLSGDVNWVNYGGKWYKRVEVSRFVDRIWKVRLNSYHIIEFINFEDATGELYYGKYPYTIEVSYIDLAFTPWHSQIGSALKCVGEEKYIPNLISGKAEMMFKSDLPILEAVHCYMGGDRVWNDYGKNAYELLESAKAQG